MEPAVLRGGNLLEGSQKGLLYRHIGVGVSWIALKYSAGKVTMKSCHWSKVCKGLLVT